MIRLAGVTLLLGLALAAPAAAAPTLERLGTFIQPTWAGAAPGDKGRVFVAERSGRISTITGTGTATYMDITGTVLSVGASERGLLSVAFPADFATSKKLYVYVTAQPAGALEVREYTGGDPASAKVLVSIPHTDNSNHNGGQLQLGPDGWLYAGTGDGGGSNDQYGHAQDPGSRLGKLLRIDPATGAVEQVGVGLRNPWRFSFDGDRIVIADVGQNAREEINVGIAANYGWPCKEGTLNGPRPGDTRCATGTHVPVLEKTHGAPDDFCSITGGYVVRDPGLPTLNGRYVYGDFCNAALRSVDLANPSSDAAVGISVSALSSFGVDACARVLVASLNGDVSRIVDGTATPCEPTEPTPTPTATATATASPTATASATPTASPTATATATVSPEPTALPARATPVPPPPTFTPDTRPCVRGIRVTGEYSLAKRRYLSVALRTNRSCRVTVSAPGFKTVTQPIEPGGRTVVKLRRTRGTAKRFTVTVRSGSETYRTPIRAR